MAWASTLLWPSLSGAGGALPWLTPTFDKKGFQVHNVVIQDKRVHWFSKELVVS
jgi:hypothetical protein